MSNLHILDGQVAQIAELPVIALASLEEELIAASTTLKARKEKFEATMTRLFGEKAQAAYVEAQKDTGTVRIMASNALELKVDRSKKVEWSQPKLRAALDAMAPEDARHYAKITLGVEEKKFAAAPPAVQAALAAARTVKAGAMKFTFADTTSEGEE